MTEAELYNKMQKQCLEEVRQSGWLWFNKKNIRLEKTQLVNESNIQTIQQLPDKICFPKKTEDVIINDKGIKNYSSFYSWSEIIATGIKKEVIPMEYMDNYKTSILIGLMNGRIVEIEIRNNIDFINDVGHLVELYKLKHKKLSGI
jgi:hypothetical protein